MRLVPPDGTDCTERGENLRGAARTNTGGPLVGTPLLGNGEERPPKGGAVKGTLGSQTRRIHFDDDDSRLVGAARKPP